MEIHVLYIDTGISKEYVLTSTGEIDLEMTGRGGTDFETAFAHIAENARQVDLVVYITDGYANDPVTHVDCTTVWVITPGGRHPMKNKAGNITIEMRDYATTDAQARR